MTYSMLCSRAASAIITSYVLEYDTIMGYRVGMNHTQMCPNASGSMAVRRDAKH